MIKHSQLEELLGKPEESANFIIFGNKLVRFSTMLRDIFNMNTTIGTKTSNQITVNYNSFSKNPETLNIKLEYKLNSCYLLKREYSSKVEQEAVNF